MGLYSPEGEGSSSSANSNSGNNRPSQKLKSTTVFFNDRENSDQTNPKSILKNSNSESSSSDRKHISFSENIDYHSLTASDKSTQNSKTSQRDQTYNSVKDFTDFENLDLIVSQERYIEDGCASSKKLLCDKEDYSTSDEETLMDYAETGSEKNCFIEFSEHITETEILNVKLNPIIKYSKELKQQVYMETCKGKVLRNKVISPQSAVKIFSEPTGSCKINNERKQRKFNDSENINSSKLESKKNTDNCEMNIAHGPEEGAPILSLKEFKLVKVLKNISFCERENLDGSDRNNLFSNESQILDKNITDKMHSLELKPFSPSLIQKTESAPNSNTHTEMSGKNPRPAESVNNYSPETLREFGCNINKYNRTIIQGVIENNKLNPKALVKDEITNKQCAQCNGGEMSYSALQQNHQTILELMKNSSLTVSENSMSSGNFKTKATQNSDEHFGFSEPATEEHPAWLDITMKSIKALRIKDSSEYVNVSEVPKEMLDDPDFLFGDLNQW